MKKKETSNDLDILLPESEVLVNGETIVIKPFLFAELPKVVKVLTKLGSGIYGMMANDNLQFSKEGNLLITPSFLECVSEMFEDHFAEIAELIAIYTGKTAAFYLDEQNGVSAEDGLVLITMIVERNYGFFTRRLAPVIAAIKAKQQK